MLNGSPESCRLTGEGRLDDYAHHSETWPIQMVVSADIQPFRAGAVPWRRVQVRKFDVRFWAMGLHSPSLEPRSIA